MHLNIINLPYLTALTAFAFPAHSVPYHPEPRASNTIQTIHQFPNGTWLENLAVRNDSSILLTLLSSPEITLYNPHSPNDLPTVATFPPPATSALGITEYGHDVFYVATNEWDNAILYPAQNGTGQIWKLDLTAYDGCNQSTARTELVASLPQSRLLNGVTASPKHDLLFVADSVVGFVWSFNTKSSELAVALNNTFTQIEGQVSLGANGIHVVDDYLYITDSSTTVYSRFKLLPDGSINDGGEILFEGVASDDFITVPHAAPAAYLAAGYEGQLIFTDGGGSNATSTAVGEVKGATSVAWGRGAECGKVLYIVSSGGDTKYALSPVPAGGALSKLVV